MIPFTNQCVPGIPKFFRFISERWPLITQEIDSPEMVEFDNLYLDMNSILHNCSHPNEGISHLTEEQIFTAIFAYIDHLFNLIKPKAVFYMAIDGVAPRAKMNQQRARRFRSAVEAEEELEKAIKRGDPLPKEPPFDTNSITPGTEFMAKVTENLKFYINQKVSTDADWQNIDIVLSGHEVPGEGEHKIMDYIRVHKSQPNYNSNTRHCVYGLDADLIMLGLVAHEPHFSILREEVVFGPQRQKASNDLTNQNFYLLHISLVRDYLQEEFKEIADDMTFEYDFERVLDDFILIMYVIGNDFLPNLPDLHLNKGAFPLLIETFKETMRRTDGYLNEKGTINYPRLAIWLEMLSQFELENFEAGAVDIEWFNKQLDNVSRRGEQRRLRQGKEIILKQQRGMVSRISSWLVELYRSNYNIKEFYEDETKIPSMELDPEFFNNESNLAFIREFGFEVGVLIIHSKSKNTWTARLDIDGIDPNEEPDAYGERFAELKLALKRWQSSVIVEDEKTLHDEKNLYEEKFIKWKDDYYKKKLHFSIHDEERIVDITENYLEGLQWVLYYYYTGICSWPWYYRFHYAPRISDIVKGINVKINFDLGKPFSPFEQLMSVLPARSRKLLPVVYHPLMTESESPIIDFYPADCETDMNGKKASWEAVVLLSFVDQDRLLKAMQPANAKLSPEEVKRNTFGRDLIFHYNPQVRSIIKSPIPAAFPDFDSHTTESEYKMPSMEGLHYIIGLAKGVKTGAKLLAGFPTLHTMVYTSSLEQAKLQVFQQPSRSTSMILTLANQHEGLTIEQFAKNHVDKIVYAQWPYLREYKVEHVIDNLMRYEMLKHGKGKKVFGSSPLERFEMSEFASLKKEWEHTMHTRNGLRFEGSKVPDIEIIEEDSRSNSRRGGKGEPIDGFVFARKVVGLAPTKDGRMKKYFSDKLEVFPVQLIVNEMENIDERFREKELPPIEEEFPLDSEVIFLGNQSYGGRGKIVEHVDQQNVIISLERLPPQGEPNFGLQAAVREKQALRYHSTQDASRILHIHPRFFSKFTSRMMVLNSAGERKTVGINLKSVKKGLKTLGYSRTNGTYWEFSDIAINVIREYMQRFPEIFKALSRYQGNDIPSIDSLLPGKSAEWVKQNMKELTAWLREKEASMVFVSLNSDGLSKQSIASIEAQIIEFTVVPHEKVVRNMKCPRYALMSPAKGNLHLQKQRFNLGDRVIYAVDNGTVPAFSKGTVIGYRSFETNVSTQVLFDYPVLTGNTFDGRLKTQRGLSVDSSLLLNLSEKQMVVRSKKPASKTQSRAAAIAEGETKGKARGMKQKEPKSQKAPKAPKEPKEPKEPKARQQRGPKEAKKNGSNAVTTATETAPAAAPGPLPTGIPNVPSAPAKTDAAQRILNQMLKGKSKTAKGNAPKGPSSAPAGTPPTADAQKLLNMLQK